MTVAGEKDDFFILRQTQDFSRPIFVPRLVLQRINSVGHSLDPAIGKNLAFSGFIRKPNARGYDCDTVLPEPAFCFQHIFWMVVVVIEDLRAIFAVRRKMIASRRVMTAAGERKHVVQGPYHGLSRIKQPVNRCRGEEV